MRTLQASGMRVDIVIMHVEVGGLAIAQDTRESMEGLFADLSKLGLSSL